MVLLFRIEPFHSRQHNAFRWIQKTFEAVLYECLADCSLKNYIAPELFVQLEDWLYQDRISWWERGIPSNSSYLKAPMAVPDYCSACLRPASDLKRCGRCKVARYCSQQCQRTHWNDGHKSSCQDVLDLKHKSGVAKTVAIDEQDVHPFPTCVIYPYATFLALFRSKVQRPEWAGMPQRMETYLVLHTNSSSKEVRLNSDCQDSHLQLSSR